MVDGAENLGHICVVAGEKPSAITRGVIVATPKGSLAVWSFDADAVTGLPVGVRGQILVGHPVASVRRTSCVVSALPRVCADQMRAALAYLRDKATRAVEHREIGERVNEIINPPRQRRRGVPFWNGDEIGEGSVWVGQGGGRATGKH